MSADRTVILRRQNKKRDFTILANALLRDDRLSYRATGLLAVLLSLPDDSPVDSEDLAGKKTEGRDAVRSALKELIAAGYVHRERAQVERGRWVTITRVYEDPRDNPESPSPTPDFQSSGNRPSVDQSLSPGSTNPRTDPPNPPASGGAGRRSRRREEPPDPMADQQAARDREHQRNAERMAEPRDVADQAAALEELAKAKAKARAGRKARAS